MATYRLATDLSFRSVDEAWIEGTSGTRRVRVPLDAFKVALEFASPSETSRVYGNIDPGCTHAEFEAVIEDLVTIGVLVVTHESTRAPATSLESLLRSDLREPSTAERLARALDAGHAVVIRNALSQDFAESVHAALDASDGWKPFEGYGNDFHFRHHNLYEDALLTGELARCKRIFDAAETKQWASRVSGTNCGGPVSFGASWYMPGDYSLPHNDHQHPRSVAFIWHLSREWDPSWGGSLYWCPRNTHVAPQFNTLTLFNVSPSTWHFVCPVAPQARGKRLAVNGWWTSRYDAAATVPSRSQSVHDITWL